MSKMPQKDDQEKRFSSLLSENSKLIEHLLKAFIDTSDKLLLIVQENRIAYINPKSTRTLGFTQKDLQRKSIDELFIANPKTVLSNHLAIAISSRGGKGNHMLLKAVSRSGVGVWYKPRFRKCTWKGVSSILMALSPQDTSPVVTSGSIVTDQKTTNALRGSNLSIWEQDLLTGDTFVDPEYFAQLGYKPHEFKPSSESWIRTIHPEYRARFTDAEHRVRKGELSSIEFEYPALTRDGNPRWTKCVGRIVEWSSEGHPVKIAGVNMVIDEKKRAEIDREESFRTLEGLISNTHEGIMIIDEKGVVREWNPAQEKITLVKRSQMVGRYIGDLEASLSGISDGMLNYLRTIRDAYKAIAHTGRKPTPGESFESKLILLNGETRYVQSSLFTVSSKTDAKLVITTTDITDAKLSRIKLEKSDERLRLALNAGNVGVWDVDVVTNERYISPMAFQILGYKPWEIDLNRDTLRKLVHPDDLEHVLQKIDESVNSDGTLDIAFRVLKKSGEYIWIQSKNRFTRDSQGKLGRFTGTITDITFEKKAEIEQIKHHEEVEKSLANHEFLAGVSYILNTNENFEAKSQEVLSRLGEFSQASRIYIILNAPDQRTASIRYQWCNRGVEPYIDYFKDVPLGMILEWTEDRENLYSRDFVNDMPSDLAEIMISRDVKSCIFYPLYAENSLFGYLGIDSCDRPREWDKLERELLRTVSNLLSFSFERQMIHEQQLRDEQYFRKITERLPHIVIDTTLTGRIEFINQTGCMYLGIEESQLKKGVFLKNYFRGNDAIKMNSLRRKLLTGSPIEPLDIEVAAMGKVGKKHTVWVKPKLKAGRLSGFSWIVMLNPNEKAP